MEAWSFTDLYDICKDSDAMSSLMVDQPSFLIKGIAEASNALHSHSHVGLHNSSLYDNVLILLKTNFVTVDIVRIT